MSRRLWVVALIVLGAFVALGLAGAGGLFLYRQQQTRQWHAIAEAAFEIGDWDTATRWYAFYLNREREDIAALERYAEASLQQEGSRKSGLAQAAMAYRQILHYEPERQDIQQALFDLQKKLGAWHEVHYLAGRMLEKDPGNVEFKHEQALALYRLGKRSEAVAAYRALVDEGVATPEAYLNLARLLRETNLTEQADDVLSALATRYPDDPSVFVARSDFFLEGRDTDQARQELQRAQALAPDDPEVVMLEARLALVTGDFDAAARAARKVLEGDPSQARMYLVLAQALAASGDKEAGLDVLRNVDPAVRRDSPELFLQLAEQLINVQQLDEAREVIAAFEKVYPDHQSTLNYLEGRVFLIEGNADAAADRLAAVIEQNPAMSPARFFLAVANLLQGKRKEARGNLEIYLKENPSDESAKRLLAEAMGVEPDPEQIIQAAQAALGNLDARPDTLVSSALALLASALRQGTVASQAGTIEELFTRALDQNPREVRAYGGLVDAYVAADMPAKARDVLRRAAEAGVPSAELARAKANVDLAQGEPGAAWAAFEEAFAAKRPSVEDARQWSRFFTLREQPDLARRVLTVAAEILTAEPERAELAVESLMLELRSGEDEAAMRLLGAVESQVAGHPAAERQLQGAKGQLVWRLMELNDARKIEEARQILQQGSGRHPDDPMLFTLQGIMALRQAPPDYEKAQSAFQKALEIDSDSVAALMGMASVTASHGALSQAMEFATKAAAIAPKSEGIDLWRAELLFRMQPYLEARNLLENILAEVPGSPAALELLVNTYLATNQLREAERTLQHLETRLGPEASHVEMIKTLRGRILLAQGNATGAEDVLRAQLAANPDDFSVVRSLAHALAQQRRNEEAEILLRNYAEAHQSDAEAFVSLARFYLGMHDPAKVDAASTALTRALLLDNDYLPALRAMVDVQLRRGSTAGILAACDRYLTRDPVNAGVLFAKASALSREPAREQEALELLGQVIALERQPEYLALRGMLYLREKNYAAALSDLRAASLEAPDTSADFDAALAETYWGLGEKELAKTHYESALAKLQGSDPAPPWRAHLEKLMAQEN
ncbi:MAG TPA: tetratricopeptide repeat protein [Candidatus Hydrogenedentes bacterium]|mgnify:FL=1|nr:tetratricopeptide repeat protein [Candidatus Hydrogenedentota bacterium]